MMFKRLSHQRFQEKKYLTLGYEATPRAEPGQGSRYLDFRPISLGP